MGRSAENKPVGNIAVAAWQMEDRADQRMSVGRLPDSINGRVRGWEGHGARGGFGEVGRGLKI